MDRDSVDWIIPVNIRSHDTTAVQGKQIKLKQTLCRQFAYFLPPPLRPQPPLRPPQKSFFIKQNLFVQLNDLYSALHLA